MPQRPSHTAQVPRKSIINTKLSTKVPVNQRIGGALAQTWWQPQRASLVGVSF